MEGRDSAEDEARRRERQSELGELTRGINKSVQRARDFMSRRGFASRGTAEEAMPPTEPSAQRQGTIYEECEQFEGMDAETLSTIAKLKIEHNAELLELRQQMHERDEADKKKEEERAAEARRMNEQIEEERKQALQRDQERAEETHRMNARFEEERQQARQREEEQQAEQRQTTERLVQLQRELDEEKKKHVDPTTALLELIRQQQEQMDQLREEFQKEKEDKVTKKSEPHLALKDQIRLSSSSTFTVDTPSGPMIERVAQMFSFTVRFNSFVESTFLKQDVDKFIRRIWEDVDKLFYRALKEVSSKRDDMLIETASTLKDIDADDTIYMQGAYALIKWPPAVSNFIAEHSARSHKKPYQKLIIGLARTRMMHDVNQRADFSHLLMHVSRGLATGEEWSSAYNNWRKSLTHLNRLIGKVCGTFGEAASDTEATDECDSTTLSVSRIPVMLLADGVQAVYNSCIRAMGERGKSTHELESYAKEHCLDALIPTHQGLKSVIELLGKYIPTLSGKTPPTAGHVFGHIKTPICLSFYRGTCKDPECKLLHVDKKVLDAFVNHGKQSKLFVSTTVKHDIPEWQLKKMTDDENSIWHTSHCRQWLKTGCCTNTKCEKKHLESMKHATKGQVCRRATCKLSAEDCPHVHDTTIPNAVIAKNGLSPNAVIATIKRAEELRDANIKKKLSTKDDDWIWDGAAEVIAIGNLADKRVIKVFEDQSFISGCFGEGVARVCVVRLPFHVRDDETGTMTDLVYGVYIKGCPALMPPSVMAQVAHVEWPIDAVVPTMFDCNGKKVKDAHLCDGIPAFSCSDIFQAGKTRGRVA